MMYLGDFPADQAIYFMWNTNDASGGSITRATDGTLSVYKDASNGTAFDLTQVTTGITNDEDVDGLTGVHSCCITTTNAWYETGHDYVVVLSASTIDGETVNAVIATFSIENRYMVGTDSAYTGTPPTVTQIRQEMDANSTKMAPSQTLNDYKATGFNTVVPDAAGVAPTAGEIRTEMEGAGTKLTLTLGDTDELQGNQGNWLTAVGFSTHSAANVWAVGTRALTDKAGFALSTAGIKAIWDQLTSALTTVGSIGKLLVDNINATISSRNSTTPPTVTAIRQEMDANSTKMAPSQTLADYKATGFSTHSAADVKTAIEAAGSHLALILGDTSELQGNQGNWATAVGFSTHNAAAIWSVATRILTANTNFNDLDAAAIKAEVAAALQDIKLDHLLNIAVDTDWATTVHLNSVIGHMADVGTAATFDRTTDALEALRSRGDAAWVTATGFNTTTPPTVTQIRQEMDANSTKMAPSQVLADYMATGFSTHSAADVKTAIEAGGSSIAQILADTHELQTNQGAWLTAAGFSVPNEYDAVIAALQTDLDNPAQYKATGFSTHSAADVKTAIEAAGSSIAQILEDTGTTLNDMIERMLGISQENFYIDSTVFTGANMTSCRIRIYSVAGSVGTASDVIATYNMTTTYAGDNLASYKMVKA